MDSVAGGTGPPLPDLILSLEQAVLVAKQLPETADPIRLLHIYSSLHQAHHRLSSFLSTSQPLTAPPPPLPQPAAKYSLSSATPAADENGSVPMLMEGDEEMGAEENSNTTGIDKVEERMRACFIQNKRPKRQLSPSWVAAGVERPSDVDGVLKGFDPRGAKLRALELVYQFHG